MCTTIRDKQKQQLIETLNQPRFNQVIHHLKTHGPIGCCAPEGHWYLTEDDLNEIFTADGRGIKGKIVNDYLELSLPSTTLS